MVSPTRVLGVLALLFWLSTGGTSALAAWSAPRAVSSSTTGFFYVTLATDARGDTAVAWASEHVEPTRTRAAVSVALRSSGGAVVRRSLWSSADAVVGDVAVSLDARGELTVAWVDAALNRTGATAYPAAVQATFRSPTGRWARTQMIRREGPNFGSHLRLAVAPDRETLLT